MANRAAVGAAAGPQAGFAAVAALGGASGVVTGVGERLIDSSGKSAGSWGDAAGDAFIGALSAGVAEGAGGASGAGGAGGGEATLYVLTAAGQGLHAMRKGPGDEAPLLLGEVEAYAGNPFGATYVLADAQYVYFADVGTVDVSQVVPVSEGDGVVYRVAK